MLPCSLAFLFLFVSSLLSNVYYNKACLVGKEQNEKHNTTLANDSEIQFRNYREMQNLYPHWVLVNVLRVQTHRAVE